MKLKLEYLNLCNIYGAFEVTSIFSFEYYKELRNNLKQIEIINEIEKLLL